MTSPVEDIIFSLLAPLAPGKSIAPDDVAKALNPESWRRELGKVRGEAIGLARVGRLIILRHNKAADPNSFKGVYRLRLPLEDEILITPEVVPDVLPDDAD
jgi:hypothetical protein